MEFIGLLGLLGLLGFFVGHNVSNKFTDLKKDVRHALSSTENISSLTADNNALRTAVNKLNEQVSSLTADNNALRDKLNERLKTLDERLKTFDEQRKTVDERLKSLDERLKKLERDKEIQTPPPPVPPTIDDFHIDKPNAVLFNQESDAAHCCQKLLDKLDALSEFLKNAPDDKKIFLRQLDNYRKKLSLFVDKVKGKKFDPENFSEEATEAFFNVLKKYFLSVVPVAIFRGGGDDPKFYRAFLSQVNNYLQACRVYTLKVKPKTLLTTEQLEYMDVVRKDTTQPAQDNLIDEVERPAYFLDYLNDDGKTESFCCEGRMVVLKFGDKK